MTPVMQAITGADGDCFAACLASILEIDREMVPRFSGPGWASVLRSWLAGLGWDAAFCPGGRAPAGWSIASQRVRDGSVHAVVCRDGWIVHDPSPRPFGGPQWPVVLWTILRQRP